jgi:signal transduction histidine kinase
LDVAGEKHPDAILLDIMMPNMDGLEVLRRLKEDPELCEIPVILVSAKSEDNDVIEGIRAGAHDYVKKPFKGPILAARLRSAVRIKESYDKTARINKQLQAEIVKRKRKEQELVQAQKLEAIGQLAAGIAHEINTPSQYIGDNVRFLEDAFQDIHKALDAYHDMIEVAKEHSLSDEKVKKIEDLMEELEIDYLAEETPKAIQQSIEGVDKVAEIVRAMKEFSHPGSDKKQSIDLNRAIESTLTVSRSEWKYAGEVVTKFDPDLPLVPCFPNEFNQVILNLIVNAAQAILEGADESSTPQGTITISTTHENDWVEVRIQDTGTGIPEEIRSKVFDHFFTTKGVGKGTGQGLAIAYSIIVEKHGGTINFESEVGEGTTFIVRLPLAMDVVLGGGVEQEEEESACLSQ